MSERKRPWANLNRNESLAAISETAADFLSWQDWMMSQEDGNEVLSSLAVDATPALYEICCRLADGEASE